MDRGLYRLSNTDFLTYVSICAPYFLDNSLARQKIALLVNQSGFDKAKFIEMCAQLKGIKIEVFTTYEDAINWLMVTKQTIGPL